jgi:uncharacterized repeat protein (TIGR02543 family)
LAKKQLKINVFKESIMKKTKLLGAIVGVVCCVCMVFAGCTPEGSGGTDPIRYTVTFDSRGGSNVASQQVNAGDLAVRPSQNPTQEGFTFERWNKDEDAETPWDFATDRVNENVTIYASWIADIATQYTVTFNSQGGSAVANQQVYDGGLIAKPTQNPTQEGFTFERWNKDEDGETPWDFDTDRVNGNVALYASWTLVGSDEPTVPPHGDGPADISDITPWQMYLCLRSTTGCRYRSLGLERRFNA